MEDLIKLVEGVQGLLEGPCLGGVKPCADAALGCNHWSRERPFARGVTQVFQWGIGSWSGDDRALAVLQNEDGARIF